MKNSEAKLLELHTYFDVKITNNSDIEIIPHNQFVMDCLSEEKLQKELENYIYDIINDETLYNIKSTIINYMKTKLKNHYYPKV